MSTPTGIRNNNYLNVKNAGFRWLDAGGKDSKTDSRGHAVFTDPAYGVRAGIKLLHTYFFRHNLRTIAEILARWAPASDTVGSLPGAPPNSPHEYSTFVAGRMGISFNQKLGIFRQDGSLGNLAELKGLFFAMAAFEIGGGFKVPLGEYHAGLELVQPGVTRDGTDSQTVNSALASRSITATNSPWKISGSVGRKEKGAANAKSDVETVQRMLRHAGLILNDPSFDPGGIDGTIIKDTKESPTILAIESFQRRFFTKPDGLVEVDGRTWRELVLALGEGEDAPDAPPPAGGAGAGQFFFPFARVPSRNWTTAPRSFAARRDSGARAHAGCDLYFPAGTVIHAVADGTVVRGPYAFYAGTFAIEIDHGSFLARYGEVQAQAMVRTGDRVVAGQPIARVGHLVGISVPSDMLHFEMYDKSAHGPLTVPAAQGARTPEGKPFMRRRDLINPTPHLNAWQTNLPGGAPMGAALAVARDVQQGFTITLKRERQELRASAGFARTVGSYRCSWNGVDIPALSGQIVERGGPGDNTTEIGDNRDLRIRKGTYPLAIQDGTNYKTYGYTKGKEIPKPGLLLKKTEERTAILIHPGDGYLSSIGCLNPSTGLTDKNSNIDFKDSRLRVIAIIDEMKTRMGAAFPKSGTIPGAFIVISGEPG